MAWPGAEKGVLRMNNLKDKLVARLERIPGICHVPYPARDDGFSGLVFQGREIGHFHDFNELDLRLGKTLIRQQGLAHPPDSHVHPGRRAGSSYIELRFHREQDLDGIVRLVALLTEDLATSRSRR